MTDKTTTVWVAGASGLVGRELIRLLAADSHHHVTALVRRPLQDLPAAVAQVQVDFTVDDLHADLPVPDQVYIALGTTMAQAGSEAAFRAVDLDAVVRVARAARQAGASTCAVVSALGADRRSAVFYNRVKGEMEQALGGMGFHRLVLARPSLLAGKREELGQPQRLGERLTLQFTAPLARLIPLRWRPIQASSVAAAMVRALDAPGPPVQVLESDQLQRLAAG